jgi:hypothetical protein
MIYAAHGHYVDQRVFVNALYGNPLTCAPAQRAINIAAELSGQWVDSSENVFQSQVTAAYDAAYGNSLNNAIIVNELLADRPLLYCNTHHAMMVVSADYVLPPVLNAIPMIMQVGVLDPWPNSAPYHLLSQPEIYPVQVFVPGSLVQGQMTFLASVQTT